MSRFPAIGVAGGAVSTSGEVLTNRQTDQNAAIGVVTGGTGEVGPHTDQGVVVTVRTGDPADSHQSRMIRCERMDSRPTVGMTAGTIASGGEVPADCQTPQAAVGIVTTGATVVGIVGCAGQGVVVAACATGRCHPDQRTVVRGISGMGRFPGFGMTAGTVAWGRFACRKTDQCAGVGVMTGGAAVMGIGGGTDQGVIVTAATVGADHGHDHAMVRSNRMGRLPSAGMAGCAVATGSEVLTNRQTEQATVGVMTTTAGIVHL